MGCITEQELDTVVEEFRKQGRSDTLCLIIERETRGIVVSFCRMGKRLSGMEDDMMSEIQFDIHQKFLTDFLYKSGHAAGMNRDTKHLRNWICLIAKRYLIDNYNAVARYQDRVRLLEDSDLTTLIDKSDEPYPDQETARELLMFAFAIVLNSASNIYIILTWLARVLMVLEYDMELIRTGDKMCIVYNDKTLYEMRDLLYRSAENISWIVITDRQRAKIDKALEKPYKDGRTYGTVKYSEFYMAKGGKYSICDWFHKMNSRIVDAAKEQALIPIADGKKTSDDNNTNTEVMDEDETLNS